MASELERAEEETIGHSASALRVMNAMGAYDHAQPWNARKPAYGEPTVHEAVVHHDVREAKQRHPEPAAERDLAERSRLAAAPVEDQRDRQRRVKHAQGIVCLEPAASRAMVRPVHSPEPAVPDLPVEQCGPEVHHHRDDDRHGYPQRRAGDHGSLGGQA